MPKSFSSVIFVPLLTAFAFVSVARADETTRQVQEELRRRHLYFNEIDGRNTPDLVVALRTYQERQGFAVTGLADSVTLGSLGVTSEPMPPADGGEQTLPDVPVLRSDEALRETGLHAALPPPPTNVTGARTITTEEASEFVRKYLAASESSNIHDELGFYADHIDYFDHGVVDRKYVENEIAVYDQRWPLRKYTVKDIRFAKSGERPTAKFRVSFQVANMPANRTAAGRIDETFGLSRRPDGALEIVTIREARVRRRLLSHVRRTRRVEERDPVVRSVGKAFRSIFRR